jgi:hypothetical protein
MKVKLHEFLTSKLNGRPATHSGGFTLDRRLDMTGESLAQATDTSKVTGFRKLIRPLKDTVLLLKLLYFNMTLTLLGGFRYHKGGCVHRFIVVHPLYMEIRNCRYQKADCVSFKFCFICDLNYSMCESDSGQGPVAGSCEHGNEPSGSI